MQKSEQNTERRMRLGANIRALRRQQHLSQRRLSMMVGTQSHTYLSEVERGLKNPSFDYICGVADALGVDVSYFFTKL